ncbi:MAG TPA: M3 family oligoendopeptidase [Candidatus Paceibacterota bacterium]
MSNRREKMETEWNLKMLYNSPDDPQIEIDVRTVEDKCDEFASKYRHTIAYTLEENKLAEALSAYEALAEFVYASKPLMYLYLMQTLDSANALLPARIAKITNRLTKAHNETLFFTLHLGKIPSEFKSRFLKSPKLKRHHYFLGRLFKSSEHHLSELEERILNLKRMPANSMWVEGVERSVNKLLVLHRKKQIPLGEAGNLIADLPKKERRQLHGAILNELVKVSEFAENEMNAILTDKKINDELRKFNKSYSATVLDYENDERTVETLVSVVSDRMKISHRFYKLKAEMMRERELTYADRAASIGKTAEKISFDKALQLTEKAFYKAHPLFAQILLAFARKGQMDVYPKKGKSGGAFCWSSLNVPTYVMLNFVHTFDSVMTLAHEMGHAVHGELSKSQPILYQGSSIATAEVASTFFEQVLFEDVFETLSAKDKIISLHNRIQDDVSTIFRQIACFNFEVELHNEVRKKGSLDKDAMAALLTKHMKSYLGPAVRVDQKDGYAFVQWGHIRRFFYVYSYAFGQITSKALFAEYRKDSSFINEVKKFLEAGSSAQPETIFASIGIDVTKPDFFKIGLQNIEKDIERLEKLIAKK